jgi:hypothetical protein
VLMVKIFTLARSTRLTRPLSLKPRPWKVPVAVDHQHLPLFERFALEHRTACEIALHVPSPQIGSVVNRLPRNRRIAEQHAQLSFRSGAWRSRRAPP